MNKKVITIVSLGLIVLISGLVSLSLTNERTKILKTLNTNKEDLYYFKELPFDFAEYEPLVVGKNNGIITIAEGWNYSKEGIEGLSFITQFKYFDDISISDELISSHIPDSTNVEDVIVLGAEGKYSSNINFNGVFEEIIFVKSGVFYNVLIHHQDYNFLGKDYLIDLINNYMKN